MDDDWDDDWYRWPTDGPSAQRDGLATKDVIDALYAPASLRLDNHVPNSAPMFMAVCAPTEKQRLIVVVLDRPDIDHAWTIRGARDAGDREHAMWRKYTA